MPATVAVPRIAEFRIDAVPPSINELMRNHRLRMTEPAKWRLIVRNASRGIEPFSTPVRIFLTFYAGTPGRPVDAPNHEKMVTDGMVTAGLIYDDRWPYVQQLILSGPPLAKGFAPYTTVRIEPMAEGE